MECIALQIRWALYITAALVVQRVLSDRYSPDWESLDSRPLPQWYDDAKVGVFMHWGVYSSFSFGDTESAWMWNSWENRDPVVLNFLKKNYPPDITYADFAADFHAEFFDPNQWADLLKYARVRYLVLTSKHHEGFTNWPSKFSWNWNAMDVGPKRDLVGDLAAAIRNRTDIHFGLYHSLFDFYNPLYLEDKASGFKTQKFVEAKSMPCLYEIVNAYKPDVVWSDGDWEAPYTYWNSTQFLAWLYNDSPVKDTVVTNDRWGAGMPCHHGGYYTCSDKFNPGVLQKHKWENCMTIDYNSWGFRRTMKATDVMDIHTLITTLAETVSCGGNLLMNVGPTGDGRIIPIFEERLRQFGDWMAVNEEAIHATRPWVYQNDTITSKVWFVSVSLVGNLKIESRVGLQSRYTSKKDMTGAVLNVYAIVLEWPMSGTLTLGAVTPSSGTEITMLGYQGKINWSARPSHGVDIEMPQLSVRQLPSFYAWVFKIQGLQR